ncbi:MAG TPA: helix-hairpin-helix domain-containing protein [Candidatus Faecousia intestinavium]|uniref:Helix-hairpin-helix domain-containing protein n=1 Tax=Candidatus Faecousia excrementigallinarum TaxID=2840806 RepID=A0A9D0Z0G5_9FIRM|nr:helix-hairpin-helix domain-containing protein [Candidatus Faecousia excrementigallinarum]HIT35395.1 helix-hairpin-helix domain-containing protein [Candidatus Faecousia intestinavium]
MCTEPTQASTAASVETTGAEEVSFPLDINQADSEALQALPGIGEVLAGRIIAYRDENGPFSSPDQLMNVEGIGEKRLEAILDYITIGG